MSGSILVGDLTGGVRVITLSNPARRNALDKAMLGQLFDAVTSAPAAVRALLIKGEPGAFSAGYDLSELATLRLGAGSLEMLPDDHVSSVFDALANSPLPSVALVTGPAYGAGCELALACDVRVGDSKARFCMPPLKLGLVYSKSGFSRFVTRVGPAVARYLFLTGRAVDAERALSMGLLGALSTDSAAETEAMTIALALAEASPMAVEGTKLALSLASQGWADDVARARYEALHEGSFRSDAFRKQLERATKA